MRLLLTTHKLQKHMIHSLPDYMVPSIFVRLHTLPLTPNGKLDTSMLPPPNEAELLEGTAANASVSPIEEELLSMVRQVLSNDAVTAQDSFFLAGGHSLLGMQLLVRLRDTFGVDLTLRQLFEAPTVKRLAHLVENMHNDSIISRRTNNSIFWIQSGAVDLAKALGDDRPPLFCAADCRGF